MRRSRKFLCLALTAAAAVIIAKSVLVRAQQDAPAGEWRAYGSDLRATKYSPLTQITAANFSSLQIAWRWKSADAFLSRTIPGRGEVFASSRVIFEQLSKEAPNRWRDNQPPILNNFKATPLMVRGRLFRVRLFWIDAHRRKSL